jgi:hypothetical protein
VVAGLATAVVVYLIRCGVFWHYVNDDAFITFRYSRFLAIGRGPYFNIGEHVEGYTNFLSMLLMAPVFRLGGEAAVPLAAKAVGVASGVGSLLVAWALVRMVLAANATLRRQASAIGVGAAALLAASPAYAVNSTSGLATTLFGFLLILGVYLSIRGEQRGSWCGAGIAFAGLVLTRPEGVFLFAVAWLGMALAVGWGCRSAPGPGEASLRRPFAAYRLLLVDAAIVASACAAHLLFRALAYDGEWLPNTYYAKAGGFWKVDAWRYVLDGIVAPFFGPIGVGLASLGGAVAVRRMKLSAEPRFRSSPGAIGCRAGACWCRTSRLPRARWPSAGPARSRWCCPAPAPWCRSPSSPAPSSSDGRSSRCTRRCRRSSRCEPGATRRDTAPWRNGCATRPRSPGTASR